MFCFNSSRIEQQIFVYHRFGCFIHAQLSALIETWRVHAVTLYFDLLLDC